MLVLRPNLYFLPCLCRLMETHWRWKAGICGDRSYDKEGLWLGYCPPLYLWRTKWGLKIIRLIYSLRYFLLYYIVWGSHLHISVFPDKVSTHCLFSLHLKALFCLHEMVLRNFRWTDLFPSTAWQTPVSFSGCYRAHITHLSIGHSWAGKSVVSLYNFSLSSIFWNNAKCSWMWLNLHFCS